MGWGRWLCVTMCQCIALLHRMCISLCTLHNATHAATEHHTTPAQCSHAAIKRKGQRTFYYFVRLVAMCSLSLPLGVCLVPVWGCNGLIARASGHHLCHYCICYVLAYIRASVNIHMHLENAICTKGNWAYISHIFRRWHFWLHSCALACSAVHTGVESENIDFWTECERQPSTKPLSVRSARCPWCDLSPHSETSCNRQFPSFIASPTSLLLLGNTISLAASYTYYYIMWNELLVYKRSSLLYIHFIFSSSISSPSSPSRVLAQWLKMTRTSSFVSAIIWRVTMLMQCWNCSCALQ